MGTLAGLMRSVLAFAALSAIAAPNPAYAQTTDPQVETLDDLIKLARGRAQRTRPELQRKLEPFLKDLTLEPGQDFLLKRYQGIHALGEGVVPLLLEKLTPKTANPVEINVAQNVARALTYFEVDAFLDRLIELVREDRGLARQLALTLLGRSKRARTVDVLAEVFPELTARDRRAAVEAANRIGSPRLAKSAAALISDCDPLLQRAIIDYIAKTRAPGVLPELVDALRSKKLNPRSIGAALEYVAGSAPADAAIAELVAPYAQDANIKYEDRIVLVGALARIAPKGHKPTLDILRKLIPGDLQALAIEAAKSMEALGDRSGPKALFDGFDDQIREDRGVENDSFGRRGEAHFAFGAWKKAISDFSAAAKNSQVPATRNKWLIRTATCYAHLKQASRAFAVLLDCEQIPPQLLLQRCRMDDPVLGELVDSDKARNFRRRLTR